MNPVEVLQDLRSLRALAQIAARGKRQSPDVARFMLDVDARVLALMDALMDALADRTYRPGAGRCFRILDPKPRQIYALPFVDRVAQHHLVAAMLPAIERRRVDQTYACRKARGTHRCLRRAAELTHRRRHVLRVDIARFFPSIDHAILRAQLDHVTPPELRWLRDRCLDARPALSSPSPSTSAATSSSPR